MPSPRFEVPAGAVDGVNTVYTVSMPYSAGTTAVFLNGLLQERNLMDGWYETNPGAGIITMKEAPRAIGCNADVVQVFFLDRTPSPPPTLGSVAFNLKGIIRAHQMRGLLSPSLQISCRITSAKSLHGHLDLRKDLRGSIKAHQMMKATIKECV
jgi:hypothetical protein